MLKRIELVARKSAVWLLKKLNPGDIRLRHHYTGGALTLDAFQHRGYWVRGKRREFDTMQFLGELIKPGETVLEAGGHIGYLTMYFSALCGSGGQVVVFEPDPENVSYLRRNTAPLSNIVVVELAIAAASGSRSFFVERLSGQNNSFYPDYGGFEFNAALNGMDAGGYRQITVDAITIDEYRRETGLRLGFVKIDIEGAEFEALSGMARTAEMNPPLLMVEVTRNAADVFHWLTTRGYLLYNDRRKRLRTLDELLYQNVFCFHSEAHRQQISRLSLDAISQ